MVWARTGFYGLNFFIGLIWFGAKRAEQAGGPVGFGFVDELDWFSFVLNST
jgi:hypothetical protein